jgi:hypothetical protein
VSTLYFHSPSGTAEVRGTEAHHMRNLVHDLTLGLLRIRWDKDIDRMLQLLPPDHSMRIIKRDQLAPWAEMFGTYWRTSSEDFVWRGHCLNSFEISLNTALAIGGWPLWLVARLAGQAELHAWVDGPNRKWLAGIIDDGLQAGLFRDGAGWDGVTALLRDRDGEEVVTSYSITGGFPDSDLAKWDRPVMPEGCHAENFEFVVESAWAGMSDAERWTAGMAGLRADTGNLELSPDEEKDRRFGCGVTAFDLTAANWERRLDEAFGIEAAVVATS